ncbi:MAG: DNA-directed RNA polymerase subunit beta [Candidatus Cloacimonetes bacterium 4572_55]|nr:MAG: DNA-directed RNA polymerase subunit beta [Candidatus Cloacimonetes bacterium 4572_55]
MPHLLDIQLQSYRLFLSPDAGNNIKLQAVFSEVFPIADPNDNFRLEFIDYSLGEPKYTVVECQERDVTYAAPLKASLRLIIKEEIGGQKRVRDIIEQEVFLGELPLMTDKGTFIINGAERVIVSQLHRSPGVYFEETIHPNGKRLFSTRIIPYRGSWIEMTMDINDIMYVHIDKRRKFPITVLLRALGLSSNDDILNTICSEEVGISENQGGTPDDSLLNRLIAEDIIHNETGEILAECGELVGPEILQKASIVGISKIRLRMDSSSSFVTVMNNTFKKDTTASTKEALVRIYNLLRPGDPPNIETAKALLDRLFFNPRRYSLARVGRYKVNRRLNLNIDQSKLTLTREDLIEVVRYLLLLTDGGGYIDDIDHLGNRRVRSVGELLANQFSVGLSRMGRIIRERMSLQEADTITPYDVVNSRTISAVVNAFFGSSQLSQFMDQTNPLAELTHKRRLSALGPGGLTRERAGFEVRDVHHTHYARMCPIETPEGPNIGLITSLSSYAKVNDLGFLVAPYRIVDNGLVTNNIRYLPADEEDGYKVAQANAPLDAESHFEQPTVIVRSKSDILSISPDEVDYMDVSPKQLVSVAAALIPFLEHDDANRALMGSNMQRQAVPLLRTDSPVVGTGMEGKAARDSGAVIIAKQDGIVEYASADRIVIDCSEEFQKGGGSSLRQTDEYRLTKFKRSNQDTCINQKPIVDVGARVKTGDVIADGAATENGELALGVNTLVAFMPWGGYNYEDAILISEKIVKDDRFTSIHIMEFELEVRDTKRGMEEITKELPNVGEEALKNLDSYGIVCVGASVHPGDILVGKVTPKGETELSPEERLLRAIFGEKAGDVRDASLKVPPGMEGIVIGTKIFSRRDNDEQTQRLVNSEIERLNRLYHHEVVKLKEARVKRMLQIVEDQISSAWLNRDQSEILLPSGMPLTEDTLNSVDLDNVLIKRGLTNNDAINEKILEIESQYQQDLSQLKDRQERTIDRIKRGDELPPGVVQLVKVYIVRKRVLSVGDKMAGRHGNKGVVAKVLPEEDMPYMEDGTPVDIVLNPLGVPSRMNVGQILETHLGWAAKKLGYKIATPVFDGASLEEISDLMSKAGLPSDGKAILYDGRTGEKFDNSVTVGIIYMMKLSHLVDDKIHARAIGPYSLVTQQPLGGKAQFGGQRFGEMEVWALEAYGAAYALQELLTVKSDDVTGRSKIYEAIVKGDNPPEPGIPESFNVLVKELQSLGLDVQLETEEN